MDMDYDPEDDEDESEASHNGPTMMWFGFVIMGVLLLWDYFGSAPPTRGTHAILAVWLMLGTCVAISEVVYR